MVEKARAKRNYKDGVFRLLFEDEDRLRELYGALSGKPCPKETKVEIVTLENALTGDMKNDLAFIIDDKLILLIEHQSTVNPNMPLRMLCYLAKEYEQMTFSKGIYSKRRISIPTPELYVFFNGTEEHPAEQEMKLSDAFSLKCDKILVEAVVKVINVNYEKGAEILKNCQALADYSRFIYMIRSRWKKSGDMREAIEESVKACLEEGILEDFLKRNGGDIVSFLFEELTREECEAIREEDGYFRGIDEGIEKGMVKGRKTGILEGKREERRIIARNLLERGMEAKMIAQVTGLTEKEIRKISSHAD